MTTALSATLSLSAVGTYAETDDITDNVQRITESLTHSFTDGTGDNQGNRWFKITGTNAASVQSILLIAGHEDIFGQTLRFDLVKAVAVINRDTTAGHNLTVSGSFFGGNTTILHANGGSMCQLSPSGYSVTNAVNDEITLDAGANSVDYEVWILGADT